MSKRVRFPANSSTKFTQKKTRHKRRVFAFTYYFFKNVGILIGTLLIETLVLGLLIQKEKDIRSQGKERSER